MQKYDFGTIFDGGSTTIVQFNDSITMEKVKRRTLVDNVALRRYEMDLGGEKAIVDYIVGPGYRILTHTEVPPKFEGQGVGRELVAGVLEDMKSKNLQVIPQCSFIASYIDRHPEWERILVRETVSR